MREAREDPNLAEVKAVLKKLQQLDLPAETPPSPDKVPAVVPASASPPSAAPHQSLSIFERKSAVFAGSQPAAKRSLRSLIYVAGAAIFIGGACLIFVLVEWPGAMSRITKAPASGKENESIVLSEARRLLGEGDVASARERLRRGAPEERAEVALMLAQSFDPNYLRTLPAANSPPNPAEAERWYKEWYELAVKSGLEMDSGRLRRIINAMH